MDWDLKMPHPWDFAELEHHPNAEPGIGQMMGQPSGLAIQPGPHCSVDLKLGGLGDFGPPDKWKEQQRSPAVTAPSSGGSTTKRARAPGAGSQNASCLVDGCKSDLSNCREYHRRHKVCEVHSKTPIVMVGGQEQRFCQQCSRFHLLVEFDEVKRSCRKRLDGHNRRRRKPQPDSINSGSMFTTHQGSRFSSYPQIFPTPASDPAWPVIVKTEEEPLYSHHQPLHFVDRQHHHHFSTSFTRKHFPFLQDTEHSICQPLLKTISAPENSGNTNKLFSPSDCALSLLSSPPQTSSINLGQIVPSANRIPMGQPLIAYSGLGLGRYSGSHGESNHHVSTTGFSCSGMVEDEHVGSTVLVSDASDAAMHCQGLFSVGGGEGSSHGGSQAIPFSWQ